MATPQPLAFGRRLPKNDWEGDDFTPGAGGKYVTCQDTAAGRDVAWATNGRIDKDGQIYRAAVPGRDPDGITLQQAQIAVKRVAFLNLVIPRGWVWSDVKAHLKAGRGLIADGWYGAVPRAYRYQAFADFGHAEFWSHWSLRSGIRVWDALNPDTTAYGRWIPESVCRNFVEELARRDNTSLYVAYVPLLPLL